MKPRPVVWVSHNTLPNELAERIMQLSTLHYLQRHRPVHYLVSHRYPKFDREWLNDSRVHCYPELSLWRWSTTRFFRWMTARFIDRSPSPNVIVRRLKTARYLVNTDGAALWLDVIHPDRVAPFVSRHGESLRGLLAHNRPIKRRLVDRTPFPPGRISITRSAGEPVQAPLSRLATPRRWLYFGSLRPEKNVPFLLRVAEEVRSEVEIRIVGGDRERFDAIVREYGSRPPNVSHHPRVPHRELESELARAELTLYAPKKVRFNRLYTSPMKIYQSILADRPVLTLRTPAIEDMEHEIPEGMLLVEDPGDFLDACRDLAGNPGRVLGIIRRISAADKSNLTWAARAKEIHHHLKDAR